MNTTMSEQKITPRQWAKAVTVLEGWRRYCKKRDSIRVRKIIERNHREIAQGATPLPPVDEPAPFSRSSVYEGRNYVDPDLLDFVTVETWLKRFGTQEFRRYIRLRPQSKVFIAGAWHFNAGTHGDMLGQFIADID